MTLFYEDFDPGTTDESTVTTGDSSFAFLSGTRVYDDAFTYGGAPFSMRATGGGYARWDALDNAIVRGSMYVRFSGSENGTREIVQLRSSGGSVTIGGIARNSSNRIVALNGTSTITGTDIAGHVTSNENWYRIDWSFTIAASTQGRVTYRICDVQSTDTNTPIATAFDSGATLDLGTTNIDRVYMGYPVDGAVTNSIWIAHPRAEDGTATLFDGLFVPVAITESFTDNLALIEATDGTPPFSIAQDSGTTTTPEELDDGSVSGTGRWLVAKHTSDTLVYTITDDASVDSDPVNVPPISPANVVVMHPNGSLTGWV